MFAILFFSFLGDALPERNWYIPSAHHLLASLMGMHYLKGIDTRLVCVKHCFVDGMHYLKGIDTKPFLCSAMMFFSGMHYLKGIDTLAIVIAFSPSVWDALPERNWYLIHFFSLHIVILGCITWKELIQSAISNSPIFEGCITWKKLIRTENSLIFFRLNRDALPERNWYVSWRCKKTVSSSLGMHYLKGIKTSLHYTHC